MHSGLHLAVGGGAAYIWPTCVGALSCVLVVHSHVAQWALWGILGHSHDSLWALSCPTLSCTLDYIWHWDGLHLAYNSQQ